MQTYIRMQQEEKMITQGMPENDAISMAEYWTGPGVMSAFVVGVTLFLGLVISLICAGILKKENPAEQMR